MSLGKLKHYALGVFYTGITVLVLAFVVRRFLPANVQALFSFSA